MAFGAGDGRQLTALMIAPDRALARQFAATLPAANGFQILAELRTYPAPQTLSIRLRQLQPAVVLLDLSTDLEQAEALIRAIAESNPAVQVIGLHARNDSEAIVRSLRQGASEFLAAPFHPEEQRQALARIRRLIEPPPGMPEAAQVLAFSSAKPGSGASTLAAHAAFALRRSTEARVLLADMDPASGAAAFYAKASARGGIDIASPDIELGGALATNAAREFLARARSAYEWVLVDLPPVFHRSSLQVLPDADHVFLLTTAELPSLHLARKAVAFLAQVGFAKDRTRLLVNRIQKRAKLGQPDVEKILGVSVHSWFPDDPAALGRAIDAGEPLGGTCELGRAIGQFVDRLAAGGAGFRGATLNRSAQVASLAGAGET